VEARRVGRLSCGGAIRVAGSAGRGRSCDWPGEGDRGWRLRLFWFSGFLLPNERGTVQERKMGAARGCKGQEREMLGPEFVVVSWGRNGCGSNNPQSSRSGQGALVLSFSKETLQRRLNREREACV